MIIYNEIEYILKPPFIEGARCQKYQQLIWSKPGYLPESIIKPLFSTCNRYKTKKSLYKVREGYVIQIHYDSNHDNIWLLYTKWYLALYYMFAEIFEKPIPKIFDCDETMCSNEAIMERCTRSNPDLLNQINSDVNRKMSSPNYNKDKPRYV